MITNRHDATTDAKELTRRNLLVAAGAAAVAAGVARPGQASAADPIRIGVVMELSGSGSSYGVPSRRAVEIAVEAAGGQIAGRPIELVIRDTQTDPQVAIAAVKELTRDQGINFLLGPIATGIVASVAPTWKETKPLWLATASSPLIEKELGQEPMFHHTYLFSYQIHPVIADALVAQIGGGKKLAILYTDDTYGRGQIDQAREAYGAKGFAIVAEEIVRAGATDMRASMTKIRSLRPDVLVALVQGTDAITVAKQAQVARLGVPYMIAPNAPQLQEWQNAVGAAQEGWIGSSVYLPGASQLPADPAAPSLFLSQLEWEKRFREKFNTECDMLAAIAFASTAMLLRAIDLAGSADKLAVAEKLDNLKADTVLGRGLHFRPTGHGTLHQLSSDLLVFQRQGGKSVIIYPGGRATGPIKQAS